jgi:ribosomal protein L6P/L9E
MLAEKFSALFTNSKNFKAMSRIGKQPIPLVQGTEFSIGADNVVTIKGQKGTSTLRIHPEIKS